MMQCHNIELLHDNYKFTAAAAEKRLLFAEAGCILIKHFLGSEKIYISKSGYRIVMSLPYRPKVYFLGSGAIAVPVLRELVSDCRIEFAGAATQIDRPAGRKGVLTPTPIGAYGDSAGISVKRVPDVNNEEFLDELRKKTPDFVVVVSFGQLLKSTLLELPVHGCVNVHASILPKYRGASPIVQCILNRDGATGVALMQMEKGLDTGAVYATWERPLDGTEYADPLEVELGEIAAKNIVSSLLDISGGKLDAVPQNEENATVCRKIKKEMGIIDWNRDAFEIEAMVRAYTPWPGAVCMVKTPRGDVKASIIKAKVREDLSGAPGQSLDCGKKEIIVACGQYALQILEIAPSGSKPMPAAAFRNGLRGEKAEFIPLI